jgi:hypothetical protein
MDRKDIPTVRLANQRFADDSFEDAHDVVSWLGAIQGQEYALTKWSIGLRAPWLKDEDVETELSQGRILRTHLLRPTWHFVADSDIRWLLKLTAPTVHQASAFMYRSLELNEKLFLKANKIIEKTLPGRSLTRDELNAELKRNKIAVSGPRLAYIIMNAELAGLICSGPRKGKQLTYALLEERVKPAPSFSREESLLMLTTRYFTSRGPATIKDFSMWSGLKMADCKRGLAVASAVIKEEKVEGETYFLPLNQRKGTVSGMYFLPIYDEMIMGYKDRSVLYDQRNKLRPVPGLRYNGTILDNGQVIGTWRRVDESKAINVQFDFFKRLNKSQKEYFKSACDHLERFSPRKVSME